jgi:hypothetical protein
MESVLMAGLNRAYKRRGNAVALNGAPVMCLDAGSRISYPGTGTAWTDLSSNANNGTLVNGPTFDSANGGSLVFDGVDDYSTVASNSIFNFGTNDFSIFLWFKSSFRSNFLGILSLDNTASGTGIMFYGVRTSGNFRSYVAGVSNDTAVNICTGNWTSIGITRSSGTVIKYINSINNGTFTASGTVLSNQTLAIGSNIPTGPSTYGAFPGNISNVNIYNRALTAAEVATNFSLLRGRYGI